MSKLRYTFAARTDLTDILLYIAADKPTAALDWVDRIEARCLLIAQYPEIGELRPELGEGIRSVSIGRYVIFHRKTTQGVEILRVIPGDKSISFL